MRKSGIRFHRPSSYSQASAAISAISFFTSVDIVPQPPSANCTYQTSQFQKLCSNIVIRCMFDHCRRRQASNQWYCSQSSLSSSFLVIHSVLYLQPHGGRHHRCSDRSQSSSRLRSLSRYLLRFSFSPSTCGWGKSVFISRDLH